MQQQLLENIQKGDRRALARGISLIENEAEGYDRLLESLPANGRVAIIGVTGPPGAGKSTLVDALISEAVTHEKKIAVLCIDPSSPFHRGALLGDRIRMSAWYTHPMVYIRSLASRGSLGGLNPGIIEICDLVQAADFDYIIIETVGVGQSEIEISGLADICVVVIVPESGDEVQTMKAGLMEIADIFVVNKSDRPGADQLLKNLRQMLASGDGEGLTIPVLKTIATQKEGISELWKSILTILPKKQDIERRSWLLAERAWQLILQKRMKDISKVKLKDEIEIELAANRFNLYKFISGY